MAVIASFLVSISFISENVATHLSLATHFSKPAVSLISIAFASALTFAPVCRIICIVSSGRHLNVAKSSLKIKTRRIPLNTFRDIGICSQDNRPHRFNFRFQRMRKIRHKIMNGDCFSHHANFLLLLRIAKINTTIMFAIILSILAPVIGDTSPISWQIFKTVQPIKMVNG